MRRKGEGGGEQEGKIEVTKEGLRKRGRQEGIKE